MYKKITLALCAVALLPVCNTSKKNTLWVAGYKTECTSGAGKQLCLNVQRGENIDKAASENFYAPIEGFLFEEGFLKKIEVKETSLDSKNLATDPSSIKYTLVKELKKMPDNRAQIDGNWILSNINDKPINKKMNLPTLKIELSRMGVSGFGGCNQYSSGIQSLTQKKIKLGDIASTMMACIDDNIESEYYQALGQIDTYNIGNNQLTFLDKDGKSVLLFLKHEKIAPDERLHNIWAVEKINGVAIPKSKSYPVMEINLQTNLVMGNDGCNDYSGGFEILTATKMKFERMGATRMICPDMEIPTNFYQALETVDSYQLDGILLILNDADGHEVLRLFKMD